MDIEFCIDSFEGALAAKKHKAKRIEVCSSLDVGGLTPNIEILKKCATLSPIETHAMIRPRAGNFHYSSREIETMHQSIIIAHKSGTKGVVFGCLDSECKIDYTTNKRLLELTHSMGMQATFHRAFDNCADPINGIDLLIEMGFDRLLTSGQETIAIDGIELLKELVSKANNQIEIMAGSGVNESNSKELAETGINALHFTIHKKNDVKIRKSSIIDEKKIKSILTKFT